MKKIFAIAAIMALSACGGDADVEDVVVEDVAVVEVSPAAGTFTGTTEDGTVWTSVLNEDGTYIDTTGGEVTETGSWTDTNGQICFVPDVAEGEEPGPTTCSTMGEIAEDGTVTVTSAEGEEMTIQKVID